MRIFLPLVLLAFALGHGQSANAKLGDTRTEVLQQMGPASTTNGGVLEYVSSGGATHHKLRFNSYGILTAVITTERMGSADVANAIYLKRARELDNRLEKQHAIKTEGSYIYWETKNQYVYLNYKERHIAEGDPQWILVEGISSKGDAIESERISKYAEVNTYDLPAFVDVFLQDLEQRFNQTIDTEQYKIEIPDRFDPQLNLSTAFDQELSVVATANGQNKDDHIDIAVNASQWREHSKVTKWYIMYHELGHDVLNLKHGQGGRMMYNQLRENYSWADFIEEKNYMFDYYIKNNLRINDLSPRKWRRLVRKYTKKLTLNKSK